MTQSLRAKPDFVTADEAATELLRLWESGKQFYPQQMKHEIIALANAYLALRLPETVVCRVIKRERPPMVLPDE